MKEEHPLSPAGQPLGKNVTLEQQHTHRNRTSDRPVSDCVTAVPAQLLENAWKNMLNLQHKKCNQPKKL